MIKYFSFLLVVTTAAGLRCWVCNHAKSQTECLRRGWMKQCDPVQNTCQLTLRHGGWGTYPLIEKSCKQSEACGNNHIQDTKEASVYLIHNAQCTREPPSSVCRCCCITDGCTQNLTDCPLGGHKCLELIPPENGKMTCYGENSPNNWCLFQCNKGYNLIGSTAAYCNFFSQWDNPPPVCQKKHFVCDRLPELENGRSFCPPGLHYHGAKCSFECNSGYTLIGASEMECLDDEDGDEFGTWSRQMPYCEAPKCQSQSIRNGRVSCSNSFLVGSNCRFSCNGEYRLFPSQHSGSNTCQRNEIWNRKPPCCRLPCPPYAKMDFVVILDSSSSVGEGNWNKTKAFVRSFLQEFTVSDDAAHFSVVRYNRDVDRNTEIRFNDYPNDKQGVLEAFDRIPYNGNGTNTGNALNYTLKHLLKDGNRPDIKDVILLITDGASSDDVVIPSLLLHQTNAVVFVLPITPPSGKKIDREEIETIASDGDNVITDALEGGFDALDEAFSRRISLLLCNIPCEDESKPAPGR